MEQAGVMGPAHLLPPPGLPWEPHSQHLIPQQLLEGLLCLLPIAPTEARPLRFWL